MESLKDSDLSREELFARVWERPATDVAEELGISGVALGKLCSRLQVPKPPRGYWARVASGETLRRPPLAAFRAAAEKGASGRRGRDEQSGRSQSVKLSQMQNSLLKRALVEMASSGIETKDCVLTYDGIRSISANLAAQVLIFVQNRFEAWVEERGSTSRGRSGAVRSLSGLVTKLLPLANDQVMVFARKSGPGVSDRGPSIIIRLSPTLQQRIAHLCSVVRENKMSYVASKLPATDGAWSVRPVYTPGLYANVSSELCVSAHEVWLQCEITSAWDSSEDHFETRRFSIQHLVPVELLPRGEIRLPAVSPRTALRPYAERLNSLREAEQVYDMLSTTGYEMERTVPDERLALADRLWFGESDNGPFFRARCAWRRLEEDLESLEQSLDAEKAELCRDVLGIEMGDIVIVESRGVRR